MRFSKALLIDLYVSSIVFAIITTPVIFVFVGVNLIIMPLYIFTLTSILNLIKSKGIYVIILSTLLAVLYSWIARMIYLPLQKAIDSSMLGGDYGLAVWFFVTLSAILIIFFGIGIALYINKHIDKVVKSS